jgi:hypothetical protein
MHIGALCNCPARPTRKSASDKPVTDPSNENWPFEYWVLKTA